MQTKSQGATEYLILLGVILVILIIILIPFLEFGMMASSFESRASESYWKMSEIGIVGHTFNYSHMLFALQNNLLHSINITQILIEDISHQTHIELKPGEQKSVLIELEIPLTQAQNYQFHVDFVYMNLRTQQSYTYFGEIPLMGLATGEPIPDPFVPELYFTAPTPAHQSTQISENVTIRAESTFPSDYFIALNWNDSLVAWWRMDEYNETHVLDQMGEHHGLNTGATQTAGRFGQAFSFDGVGDHISIGHNSQFNFVQGSQELPFTMSAWINIASDDSNNYILQKHDITTHVGQGGEYRFFVTTEGILRLDRIDGAAGDGVNNWARTIADEPFTNYLGQWKHVAVVHPGGDPLTAELELYVDGQLVSSETFIGSSYQRMSETETPLELGRHLPGTVWETYFSGSLDQVMIFNRALSESEIQSLYNASADNYERTFSNLVPQTYSFQAFASNTQGQLLETSLRQVTIEEEVLPVAWDGNQTHIFNDWSNRFSISSDDSLVNASYPYGAVFDLSQISDDDFWDSVQSDGRDIRITLADGQTQLARGVRDFNASQKRGIIYFYADELATDTPTEYFVYFNNSLASDFADDDLYGMHNVWSEHHAFYSTMSDKNNTHIKDETQNDFESLKTAPSQIVQMDGLVGYAQNLTQISGGQRIIISQTADQLSGHDQATIFGWFYIQNLGIHQPLFGFRDDSTNELYLHELTSSNVEARTRVASSGHFTSQQSFSGYYSQWTHLALVRDGTSLRLYYNGNLITSRSAPSGEWGPSLNDLHIGGWVDRGTWSFRGFADELGFVQRALSEEELQTLVNIQQNNSAFWTIGDVEIQS
ncbi:MAG: LamG domain-containing protein [Candidatus Woesearchaeota archaeon]